MHVRGIAGQEDPSVAIARGLASHVCEPRHPDRTVNAVVGPAYGDELFTDVAQRGLTGSADLSLSHDESHTTIVGLTYGMHAADSIVVNAVIRLPGHLELGDQPARRRIRPRKRDAGRFPDQTAPAVAPHEVFSP